MSIDNIAPLKSEHHPLTVDVSVVDSISSLGIDSLMFYCMYFDLSEAHAKISLLYLLDGLFLNQDHSSLLVLPHNIYEQFKFLMSEKDDFNAFLSHLVKHGPDFVSSCLRSNGECQVDMNLRIKDAKQLLELNGYIVLNHLNKLA